MNCFASYPQEFGPHSGPDQIRFVRAADSIIRLLCSGLALLLLLGCASRRPKYKPALESHLQSAPAAADERRSPYKERVPLHPIAEALMEDPDYVAAMARVGSEPLSIDDCLVIALRNNRMRPVSRLSTEIAEAQLRQALSFYWPEVKITSTYTVQESDPHNVVPESQQNITVEGLAPIPVNLDVTFPEQKIKLADRKTWTNQLEMTWPLFTGGQRGAVVRQARFGVEAALEEERRTDLQLIEDIQRYYYGAVLAQNLRDIVYEALLRMDVTLDLTERLWQAGSETVDKTEYYRIKVFVEGLRATLAMLEPGAQIARSALVQTMGLPWESDIALAATAIPFEPLDLELSDLAADAYVFNPDWNRLRAGLQAAEAKVREARAGYFPKVALFGRLIDISNDYDAGVMTPDQKETWVAGVGLEMPLFRGFRTLNEVREARARLEQVKNQGILLREGLALLIKQDLYTMIGARHQADAARIASDSAVENRELHLRAYQDDLVEIEDLIEAQLMEVTVRIGYVQALYAHKQARIELASTVGRRVEDLLAPRDPALAGAPAATHTEDPVPSEP